MARRHPPKVDGNATRAAAARPAQEPETVTQRSDGRGTSPAARQDRHPVLKTSSWISMSCVVKARSRRTPRLKATNQVRTAVTRLR